MKVKLVYFPMGEGFVTGLPTCYEMESQFLDLSMDESHDR